MERRIHDLVAAPALAWSDGAGCGAGFPIGENWSSLCDAMPHVTFTIDEVADYLHVERRHIERLAHEHAIPCTMRGGRLVFSRGEIDTWASRRLLGLAGRDLDWYHKKTMQGTRALFPQGALVPALLQPEGIDLALAAKTKAAVIRDMVALAGRTGLVLDPPELRTSVAEREALCPTALPGGLALLHASRHQAYRLEGSFLVLGRTIQAIPFGAPDGRATRVFFLVCCEDERIHLHTLARLCLLALKTDIIARLLAAPGAEEAYEALVAAEREVLPAVEAGPAKGGKRS